MQTSIPCVLMRGGTSKGPYFLASDLPEDKVLRDKVLLAVMGSPDQRCRRGGSVDEQGCDRQPLVPAGH